MTNKVFTIKNEFITINISSLGAEMQSVKNAVGIEYLWQGHSKYWDCRAMNLTPYIGRATQETYTLNGKSYHMGLHGFAWSSLMSAENKTSQSISFAMKSNSDTRKQYPYDFEYRVQYRLLNNCIVISYRVINKSQTAMYFGLGGHPGFNVPLESSLCFTDYRLEFSQTCSPVCVGLSEACFVSGEEKAFPLVGGRRLLLSHELFCHDAIILVNMDTTVTLKTLKDSKAVTVSYPQMRYLAIWHASNTDSPYICVEPWTSLPSRQGFVEDIKIQPNLIRLPAGEVYENTWSITVH